MGFILLFFALDMANFANVDNSVNVKCMMERIRVLI